LNFISFKRFRKYYISLESRNAAYAQTSPLLYPSLRQNCPTTP
jgi:hypothetical protein